MRTRFGFLEWVPYLDYAHLRRIVRTLTWLGVRHWRTGISWADSHRPQGQHWITLVVRTAFDAGIELLPCITFTPPSLGEVPYSHAPPKRLMDYADFVDELLANHGAHIGSWIQLWNEPNGHAYWHRESDLYWHKFSDMIRFAAARVHAHGKKALLGGICPFDPGFLAILSREGVLSSLDGLGIHTFPGTGNWESYDYMAAPTPAWPGWDVHLGQRVRRTVNELGFTGEIFIDEIGLSRRNEWRMPQEAFLTQAWTAANHHGYAGLFWYSLYDIARCKQRRHAYSVYTGYPECPHEHVMGASRELLQLIRSGRLILG